MNVSTTDSTSENLNSTEYFYVNIKVTEGQGPKPRQNRFMGFPDNRAASCPQIRSQHTAWLLLHA